MDKKNVQFLKTQGFYQTRNFLKVILDQKAHNTDFLLKKVLAYFLNIFWEKGLGNFYVSYI
jgi:hypothetical protein